MVFCGNDVNDIPTSTGDTAYMIFTSDSSVQRSGFLISYVAVNVSVEETSIQSITHHILTGKQIYHQHMWTIWLVWGLRYLKQFHV